MKLFQLLNSDNDFGGLYKVDDSNPLTNDEIADAIKNAFDEADKNYKDGDDITEKAEEILKIKGIVRVFVEEVVYKNLWKCFSQKNKVRFENKRND